ncbi:hypothetical protein AX045_001348 [Escherichia coli]|nr:hypothetical protein [Escherichia coli]
MSNLNQIKGTEVPARVTYIEGTIDPLSLYDAPPINLCVRVPVDFLTPRHKTKEDGFIRAVMFMAAAGPLKCGGGKNESDLNYVMRLYYGRNIKTDIERSLDIPVVKEMRGLYGFGGKDCYGFNTQEDVRAALNAVPSEYMTKAEKRACVKLYPSNKQLGIAPPPQMGFQFNACRLTAATMRRLNKRDYLRYRCRH